MAGLNSNGLTIKRLPDIISELEAALRLQYGNDVDLTSSSFLGIQNVIYAAAIAENWELLQTLYNAFIIDVAQGKQLDDILALLNLKRLTPTKTFGDLNLYGVNGTVVPVGTQFSDTLGNVYENTVAGSLTLGTSRTPVNFAQTGGAGFAGDPSTTWTVTIDGDLYTYQTIWPNINVNSVVAPALQAQIPASKGYYIETRIDNNPEFVSEIIPFNDPLYPNPLNIHTTFNVINKDENTPISVVAGFVNAPDPNNEDTATPNAAVGTKVSTFQDTVNVEGVVVGNITTNQNSLINIITPVTGLSTVNNPSDLVAGRTLESDEEARARFKSSSAVNGSSTVPSIEARLSQVDGVSKAFVVENQALTPTASGIPAKAYECVVIGGSDADIAKTIWESKPAAIELHGSITTSITDDKGRSRAIKFSRPKNIYTWVKVYYSKYSEEEFPTTGEDSMAAAVLTLGNSFGLAVDVIPKRFYGTLYSSTKGIQDLRVLVATSTDPIIEPNIVNFKEITIPISDVEVSSFTSTRIQIILE